MNPCNATTLSHLDTGWEYTYKNYAFIMNNNDKSIPNVPDNYQNWIEIVVMAIKIYTLQLHYNAVVGAHGRKTAL